MKRIFTKKKYENIISLGHFCSVALEMERYGLRSHSYPFDWLISDNFGSVIDLINNNFEGFFDKLHFIEGYQDEGYVRNDRFHVDFYHDFVGGKSLDSQLIEVHNKYDRRIKRFYRDISNKTLFIRYVGSREEFDWIYSNRVFIEDSIRKYCEDNKIVYIGKDYGIIPRGIEYYFVSPDKNDTVARHFVLKSKIMLIFFDPFIIGFRKRINNSIFQIKKHIVYKK